MAKKLKVKTHVVREHFEYEERLKYRQDRIPLGVDQEGKRRYLNLGKSAKILICGSTGDGKSWLMRSLMCRHYLSGGYVVVLTDLGQEYYTMRYPVQKKFRKFLMRGEHPQGFPTKVYRPFFLTKLTNIAGSPGNIACQFNINDLNLFDLFTLLDVDQSINNRIALETVFRGIESGVITNLEKMRQNIDKNPNVHSTTKKNLSALLKNLEKTAVLGDQFSGVNIIRDLLKGNIVVLELSGFERAARFINYSSSYVAIVLRQLMTAKKEGLIPKHAHLLINLDEINKFCPNQGNPTSKKAIIDALDLFRKGRGTMVFSTQDYKRIPETILEQCNIIMLGHQTTGESAKMILKEKYPKSYDSPMWFGVDVRQDLGKMRVHKDGNRDWMFIDAKRRKRFIFRPYGPLAMHKEE